MEKSFIFNEVYYKAEDFRNYFSSFIGNGVFPIPSNNLQVIANNNMTVTIKSGKGWINGAIYENTDNFILPITVADGALNRIDRVVLRFDTKERNIHLEIKKGVFSSNPVAQNLQRDTDAYELALADIQVRKGVISINQGDITDLRLNSDFCGLVTGTIKQIDVTTLYNQFTEGFKLKEESFEKQFFEWFIKLKDTLGESAAGNLQNQIDSFNLKNDITGTTQRIIFENDYPKKILHVDKDSSVLRTDEFNFTEDLITETRTLYTGETLIYKYNLNTLEIEVI